MCSKTDASASSTLFNFPAVISTFLFLRNLLAQRDAGSLPGSTHPDMDRRVRAENWAEGNMLC